jgi:hypothetical protein
MQRTLACQARLGRLRSRADGAPQGDHRILHQITRWVLRTARLRAPATQPMKGAARERRGTSSAALRSAPEVRKPRRRYPQSQHPRGKNG